MNTKIFSTRILFAFDNRNQNSQYASILSFLHFFFLLLKENSYSCRYGLMPSRNEFSILFIFPFTLSFGNSVVQCFDQLVHWFTLIFGTNFVYSSTDIADTKAKGCITFFGWVIFIQSQMNFISVNSSLYREQVAQMFTQMWWHEKRNCTN